MGRSGEEMGSRQFGATVMIHQPDHSGGQAKAQLSNVEIYNAGQAFRLGRYPVHFHINGHMNNSYVRGCSIHHTFNRAVNIHNTHDLLIEHNVVYDVMGGAIFLEDGIETGNVLQYNLALGVRASSSLLNDDITPAGFWITHPSNTVRHNHAAGGTDFGFWYRMHEHPDGPSFDPDIWPQKAPMGEFFNNTAHSLGQYGLWIFEEYYPELEPAVFDTLIAWNNLRGAEWVKCGPLQFVNFIVANNDLAGIDMLFNTDNAPKYSTEGSMVKDAVISAHHQHQDHPPATRAGLVLPFDQGFIADGIDFINFDGEEGRDSACIDTTKITCVCSVLCAGYNYKFYNINYVNCNHKAYMQWEHQLELEDMDGSLTGTVPGARVVASSGLLPPNNCQVHPEWSYDVEGSICTPENGKPVDLIRFTFNNPQPSSLLYKNVIVTNA